MGVLEKLEPKDIFYYFEEISRIPRGSGNEKAISDYMVDFAKNLGLWVKQDEVNNIYIKKPASPGYEHLPTVILQGHLDMVCEKNNDVIHDFEKDGIQLYIEDDFIKAKGTTLGADNGVAIAYQMAILADNTLKHPAIEAFMTTDEETGMLGVAGMHPEYLDGRVMINLDTDIEGEFLVSCAGGVRAHTKIALQREESLAEASYLTLSVSGLLGGHSGGDIHLERANATLVLARILKALKQTSDIKLCELMGGSKDNVIPREAKAVIAVQETEDKIRSIVKEIESFIKEEYSVQDPNLTVEVKAYTGKNILPMTAKSTQQVIDYLLLVPNGVIGYSQHIKGLVETSLNLGVVKSETDHIAFVSAIRSSMPSKKEEVKQKLKTLAEFMAGSFSLVGDYPAWVYVEESKIKQLAIKLYQEMYGHTPEVKAIHAGLECGFITEKIPGVDIIALGPNAYDIHSPKERVSISSMARVYEYLISLLEKMTEY